MNRLSHLLLIFTGPGFAASTDINGAQNPSRSMPRTAQDGDSDMRWGKITRPSAKTGVTQRLFVYPNPSIKVRR